MVGDTETGTRRAKAMIWRAQMALYLMGRVYLNPLMKVMTKGATNRPSLARFSVLNPEIRVKSERRKYLRSGLFDLFKEHGLKRSLWSFKKRIGCSTSSFF